MRAAYPAGLVRRASYVERDCHALHKTDTHFAQNSIWRSRRVSVRQEAIPVDEGNVTVGTLDLWMHVGRVVNFSR